MENNNLNTQIPKEVVDTNKKSTIFRSKYFKITLVISLALIIYMGYWLFINIKLINNYSYKTYPGTHILNEDFSGLTKEQLHNKLISLVDNISNKKISVKANNQTFDITYKDLESTINYDELEDKMLSFGKDENFFKKLSLIKKAENKEFQFEILFNDEKLNSFVSSISDAVDISPTNASINISGSQLSISNDSTGLKLNTSNLINNIKNEIKDMDAPNIVELTGEVEVVEANVKASSLNSVNSKISSFSTTYKIGPSGTNLQLASNNIDNNIIMPGETFSTEKAIGPTTLENGFVEANTYVAGQVVPGVGGGVCQVASTLYNTILRAGIIPTERLNHMMTVSYVPIGLDATLADNLIDLKFVNEFEYPIVINSYAGNGTLTIEFWSNDSVKNGITYEPVSVPLGPLSADTYLHGYNSNGELVVNEYLDRSTYQPLPN